MKSRILVVDDDIPILELLRTILESEGYDVRTFDSGTAALKYALRHPPDAAIIDLMMPTMNGLDLIQALRDDQRTHQIPVLVCSAYYGDLRHITADLNHGTAACLRKPFQIQELLKLTAAMVATRERDRDRDQQEVQPEAPTPIASTPGRWTPLIAPTPPRGESRPDGAAARTRRRTQSPGRPSRASVQPVSPAEIEALDDLRPRGRGTG